MNETPKPILPLFKIDTREYTIGYGTRAIFRRWADKNMVDYAEDKRNFKSKFLVEASEQEHAEIRKIFLSRRKQ